MARRVRSLALPQFALADTYVCATEKRAADRASLLTLLMVAFLTVIARISRRGMDLRDVRSEQLIHDEYIHIAMLWMSKCGWKTPDDFKPQ